MVYLSLFFYAFLVVLTALYYLLPLKIRWTVLLVGSVAFYGAAAPDAWWIFAVTVLISYFSALWIFRLKEEGKKRLPAAVLAGSILLTVIPWVVFKSGYTILTVWLKRDVISMAAPLGISFYTLQIVSYLADVYRGKITPQRNPFRYLLFATFFPQIVQGPVPRYEQLGKQLYEGHKFDEEGFVKGLHLIIWGFFLKLMIADKAALVVNTIFENSRAYAGCYILLAGVLYSIELYTDFMACVSISRGAAALFGIGLQDNFRHPYMAVSIKDFWRRWHITLSEWLRDYIYIPLGGSRKGKIRKYGNLMATFLVSGIWHGAGWNFLFWGMLHGIYQIVGDVTASWKNKIYEKLGMPDGSFSGRCIRRIGTFFWVMSAWIIFRAGSLREGLFMIKSMFATFNPWVLFNDSLFALGLDIKDFVVMLFAILVLCLVSVKQEKGSVRDWILRQNIVIRWIIYLVSIVVIWVFGTYGFGFDTQEFIYGGF